MFEKTSIFFNLSKQFQLNVGISVLFNFYHKILNLYVQKVLAIFVIYE